MDWNELIRPGMYREDTYAVEEEQTALHVGSGSLRVLATPWMIAFMERTARSFLGSLLPAGYSSVGVRVDVRHLAPSPVGSIVKARAQVISLDGSKVDFSVQAWDGQELIGDGQHQRVIIDETRFLRRVASKSQSGNLPPGKPPLENLPPGNLLRGKPPQ